VRGLGVEINIGGECDMWGLKRERSKEWTHSFERDREGSWGKIGLGIEVESLWGRCFD